MVMKSGDTSQWTTSDLSFACSETASFSACATTLFNSISLDWVLDTLDADVGSRGFRVPSPEDVLLFDLPVILVDAPLHGIKDDRLIQIRPATSIIYRQMN